MEFAPANIFQDFKTAARTEQGTLDDNGNEVILGPRLNDAVKHWANGYLKHLELGPENKATDERAKLLDLHWGHIEHDGALLRGLGAAMTNFATTLDANVRELAKSWQGESYDAFTTAIDKVRQTLGEYGDAATVTGDGLVNAMSQVREMYQTFADDSADKHLNFGNVSQPNQWHRMTDHEKYSGFELADACPMWHMPGICTKDNDEQRRVITDHWVTERRWEICKADPCDGNAGRVIIMYHNMVDECQGQIDRIKGKLHNYFGAVDTVVDGVTKLYKAALGNVYNLANDEVFSSLRIMGGQPAGGSGAPDSGHPADSGSPGSGYPADGGSPSGGDAGPAYAAEPMPAEPEPAPVEDTAPADAVAQEPPAADPAADQRESVQVTDGDRTIGVTSPDGEGHVLVTVQDASGTTKSYELDFAAASGLSPSSAEPGTEGAEQVPARTDGKCVIQDGALTITAERPLFSPDSIKLVVDDGSGGPTTYNLDFEPQDTAAQGNADPGAAPSGEALASADPAGAGAPTDQPQPPVGADHLTSPQSSHHGDQAGSVSGVLVPDQPGGEAELAKAPDDSQPSVGGMAGAGMPMMGGPSDGGSEGGRAGSGWSVHGDLFDSGEPVYSMHGVLGDDEGTTE